MAADLTRVDGPLVGGDIDLDAHLPEHGHCHLDVGHAGEPATDVSDGDTVGETGCGEEQAGDKLGGCGCVDLDHATLGDAV